jgi:hypothetical protein
MAEQGKQGYTEREGETREMMNEGKLNTKRKEEY